MKLFALTLFSTIAMYSCTSRELLLTAPAISMSSTPKPSGKYKDIGDISSSYCLGDDAISSKDLNIGLIDEVVARAQKQSKSKYIRNASIYSVTKPFSKPCIELEGTAAR